MAEISNKALTIAIQAIDREIRQLRRAVEADEATPEEELLLDDRERAAEELETAYDAATKVAINLPAYDQLVRARS